MQVIGKDDDGIGSDRILAQGFAIGLAQARNIVRQQGLTALRKAHSEEMAGTGGVDTAIA